MSGTVAVALMRHQWLVDSMLGVVAGIAPVQIGCLCGTVFDLLRHLKLFLRLILFAAFESTSDAGAGSHRGFNSR